MTATKKKPVKKILRIDIEKGILDIKALVKKRFKVIGFGMFCQNIKKGEISISAKALAAILKCPYRSGLQGMEIFAHAPHVLAWGAPVHEIKMHTAHVSVHKGEAKKWFKEVCVVEETML